MKEATGETSMTMITLVAIGVIAAILAVMWPKIQNWIEDAFDDARGECHYDPETRTEVCD